MSVDLASGERERLGSMPSPEVRAIPGSPDRFLVTIDRGGGEDFARDPVLSVVDDEGNQVRSIGAGFAPLVKPDGSKIAYLRSTGDRFCEGEVCSTPVAVRVAGMDGGSTDVLPSAAWNVLSWAGEDLIVVGPKGVALTTMDGELTPVDLQANEVWGASPDGDHMVVVTGGRSEVRALDTGAGKPLDVRGLPADGEWSPRGDELLVVFVKGAETELVRVDPATGDATPVPGSDGAMGPIMWGPDGSTFAYVRADGLKLEAVFCESGNDCRVVLRWAEGITPLALVGN